MKKVGLLTFHRAVNYGAVLQTYALNCILKKYGADIEIIDYRNELIEAYYKFISSEIGFKANIKSMLFYLIQRKRNKQFIRFQIERLDLSKKIYNYKNISEIKDKYDCFIVGSDQVWNYTCTKGDKNYLFDFMDESNDLYSYAACIGKMSDWQLAYMNFKDSLSKFRYISVREQQTKQLLEEQYNIASRVDLDPTLLLESYEWDAIAKKPEIEYEYILAYSVNLPERVRSIANSIAKKMNKKLIIITLNNKFVAKNGEINKSLASPEEFLGYIKNAKFVITNSFHGTVFSVIYKKQFITIMNNKNGLDNSRLVSLMNSLGLEKNLINDTLEYDEIDFQSVDAKLHKMREDSIEYLENIITKER